MIDADALFEIYPELKGGNDRLVSFVLAAAETYAAEYRTCSNYTPILYAIAAHMLATNVDNGSGVATGERITSRKADDWAETYAAPSANASDINLASTQYGRFASLLIESCARARGSVRTINLMRR